MRPFSTRFCCDSVEFAPASWPGRSDPGRGNAKPTYPVANTGPVLAASVQRSVTRAVSPDGNVFAVTTYCVLLHDDPSALNSGAGVRKADAFRYKGLLLVTQSDVMPPDGLDSLWRAECVDAR